MAKSPSAQPRRAKNAAAPARQETPKDRHWQAKFLASLAETSNVAASAEAAGVSPCHPYKVKRSDAGFARAWFDALIEGYDALEMEVLHRLRFGEPVGGDRKFDNGAALRLLAQHRETVSRHRAVRENEDLDEVRATIDAKLAKLREQVLAREAAERARG